MVDAPVVGASVVLPFLLFVVLGQDLVPGLVLLLVCLIVSILLVLALLTLLPFPVLVFHRSGCNELGGELELPL